MVSKLYYFDFWDLFSRIEKNEVRAEKIESKKKTLKSTLYLFMPFLDFKCSVMEYSRNEWLVRDAKRESSEREICLWSAYIFIYPHPLPCLVNGSVLFTKLLQYFRRSIVSTDAASVVWAAMKAHTNLQNMRPLTCARVNGKDRTLYLSKWKCNHQCRGIRSSSDDCMWVSVYVCAIIRVLNWIKLK